MVQPVKLVKVIKIDKVIKIVDILKIVKIVQPVNLLKLVKWSQIAYKPQFMTLLASKRASRHNGVHFFDISTSKSVPMLRCFVRLDLDMCFAPQQCALVPHLNF